VTVQRRGGRRRRKAVVTRLAFAWHRWIGLAAALLFLVLALTGPLLTRGESLQLTQRFVDNDLLLALYPTEPMGRPVGVKTDAGWVVSVDGVVTLDDRLIGRDQGELLGAVVVDDLLLVATSTALTLQGLDGTLIERIAADSLPGPLLGIGYASAGAILSTTAGTFQSDDGYLTWILATARDVVWSVATDDLPAEQLATLRAAYRHQLVTVYRFIADVHSGRVLGAWGPYLMDAAAVAMLLMVLSGFVNWLSTRRRRQPGTTR